MKQLLKKTFPDRQAYLFYAIKANPLLEIQHIMFKENIGIEAITEEELQQTLSFGGHHLVVNGHYKTDSFLKMALLNRVCTIHVESVQELKRIQTLAQALGLHHVSVGIRPQFKIGDKIGMSDDEIRTLVPGGFDRCFLHGLHFHAGWNVKNDEVIQCYLDRLGSIYSQLQNSGFQIDTIDFGGSFCELATEPFQFSRRLNLYKQWLPKGIKYLFFEPGRALVGDCGYLECFVVEKRNAFYCLNTCAYTHKMIGASLKVFVIPKRYRQKDYPAKIKFSGFWPSQSDFVEIEGLDYTPEVGDQIIFCNMGAYVHDLGKQFEFNKGVTFNFKTNLSILKSNLDKQGVDLLKRYWDWDRDALKSLPTTQFHKKILLKAITSLFFSEHSYQEQEINRIIHRIWIDVCQVRRELVVNGYMIRKGNIYHLAA